MSKPAKDNATSTYDQFLSRVAEPLEMSLFGEFGRIPHFP